MQDILVEQNIIITEPCKTLRTLGRNALAGKWKPAIIAMCVFMLVMELPVAVFDALFGKDLFLIPAMFIIIAVLTIMRSRIEPAYGDSDER